MDVGFGGSVYLLVSWEGLRCVSGIFYEFSCRGVVVFLVLGFQDLVGWRTSFRVFERFLRVFVSFLEQSQVLEVFVVFQNESFGQVCGLVYRIRMFWKVQIVERRFGVFWECGVENSQVDQFFDSRCFSRVCFFDFQKEVVSSKAQRGNFVFVNTCKVIVKVSQKYI